MDKQTGRFGGTHRKGSFIEEVNSTSLLYIFPVKATMPQPKGSERQAVNDFDFECQLSPIRLGQKWLNPINLRFLGMKCQSQCLPCDLEHYWEFQGYISMCKEWPISFSYEGGKLERWKGRRGWETEGERERGRPLGRRGYKNQFSISTVNDMKSVMFNEGGISIFWGPMQCQLL